MLEFLKVLGVFSLIGIWVSIYANEKLRVDHDVNKKLLWEKLTVRLAAKMIAQAILVSIPIAALVIGGEKVEDVIKAHTDSYRL
jgi:hypothetical protein